MSASPKKAAMVTHNLRDPYPDALPASLNCRRLDEYEPVNMQQPLSDQDA